jgi:hypothetical protein
MISTQWKMSGLEHSPWTPNWSIDINPVEPDSFIVQQTTSGVQIFCEGRAYAGQLAAQVNSLLLQTETIVFSYAVTLDESIERAQIIETDSKITDADQWTYDGSLQFNVQEDWMLQVGNPWQDTGVKIPLQVGVNFVTVTYKLDYEAHTLRIVSVNGFDLNNIIIRAEQIKPDPWQASTIVTQLQLCLNYQGGIYNLMFGSISYEGQ